MTRHTFIHRFRNRLVARMTVILCEGYLPFCRVEWSDAATLWEIACVAKERKAWANASFAILAEKRGLRRWQRYNFFRLLTRASAGDWPMVREMPADEKASK